ncbi:MAG TPA: SAM-dependent methyltransferase [Anaeromyxobacteraceae bacterium]|nr:SAM-dependent methyltransferase [Anaeromyxobacteraceae bacterium]
MATAALTATLLAGCAATRAGAPSAPEPPPSLDFAALVAAPDRTAEDRALDPGRHPADLVAFLRLRPGMRVAELGAGGGYTAELMARAVGPTGTVYAQNPDAFRKFIGPAWPARLARPVMRCAVRVDREFDDPLPPDAHGLDLVLMNAVFHDTIWLRTDRARMVRAIFDALAPGGAFVVIDSSARPGADTFSAAYELHRVDEALVRREVEAAGFRAAETSDFLRNPADARDWNAAPNEAGARRGTSDRFAIRFVKP